MKRSASISSGSSSSSSASSSSSSSRLGGNRGDAPKRRAEEPSQDPVPAFAYCHLPPHSSPLPFFTPAAFESHYQLHHAFRCNQVAADPIAQVDGIQPHTGKGRDKATTVRGGTGKTSRCAKTFPSEHILQLHLEECHSAFAQERQRRNEPIFACFVESCPRMFANPKLRRLHLIDAHHYPRTYFFSLPNHGIGQLVERYGPGASLVRPSWAPRDRQAKDDDMAGSNTGAGAGSNSAQDEKDQQESELWDDGMDTDPSSETEPGRGHEAQTQPQAVERSTSPVRSDAIMKTQTRTETGQHQNSTSSAPHAASPLCTPSHPHPPASASQDSHSRTRERGAIRPLRAKASGPGPGPASHRASPNPSIPNLTSRPRPSSAPDPDPATKSRPADANADAEKDAKTDTDALVDALGSLALVPDSVRLGRGRGRGRGRGNAGGNVRASGAAVQGSEEVMEI